MDEKKQEDGNESKKGIESDRNSNDGNNGVMEETGKRSATNGIRGL